MAVIGDVYLAGPHTQMGNPGDLDPARIRGLGGQQTMMTALVAIGRRTVYDK